MTGRSVSVNEGASVPRYGIASATALRWIFDYPFCAVFLLQKMRLTQRGSCENPQKKAGRHKKLTQDSGKTQVE